MQKAELAVRLRRQRQQEFWAIARELLKDPNVLRMRNYPQHRGTSCLTHCTAVAWYSFLLYKRLGLRGRESELVRGALLHDFFLYDWHKPDHGHLHGYLHPARAARNAARYFPINALEREIICRHMWPLTPVPPLHLCALIVSLVDKCCTLSEVAGYRYPSFLYY